MFVGMDLWLFLEMRYRASWMIWSNLMQLLDSECHPDSESQSNS